MGATHSFFFGEETVKSIARRSLAECVGTFILVFCVALIADMPSVVSPFIPGMALGVMVFSFGHISLGSFNPAVTIAMATRRILSIRAAMFYCLAEMVGGIAGALLAQLFVANGSVTVPIVGTGFNVAQGFFAELIGSALLCTTVLNTGCSSDNEGNSFFGLAIGGSLALSALVFGPISGSAINPAVGLLALLGPPFNTINQTVASSAWIYFVAPPIAGFLSALLFRLLSPKDHAPVSALMKGPVDHRNAETGGRRDPFAADSYIPLVDKDMGN